MNEKYKEKHLKPSASLGDKKCHHFKQLSRKANQIPAVFLFPTALSLWCWQWRAGGLRDSMKKSYTEVEDLDEAQKKIIFKEIKKVSTKILNIGPDLHSFQYWL